MGTSVFPHTYGLIINQGEGKGWIPRVNPVFVPVSLDLDPAFSGISREGGRRDRGFERFENFRKKSFEDFVEISTLDFLFSTLILGKRNWNVTKFRSRSLDFGFERSF